MQIHSLKTAVSGAAALTLALVLTACGSGGSGSGGDSSEPTEPLDSYTAGAKLMPFEPTGTWVGGLESDTMRFDLYQVGFAEAPKDSRWANSETDEPTFVKGDRLIMFQYIVTNVSDEPLPLDAAGIETTPNADDNEYLTMTSEYEAELLPKKVPAEIWDYSKAADVDWSDPSSVPDLEPDMSMSVGEVYPYLEGAYQTSVRVGEHELNALRFTPEAP